MVGIATWNLENLYRPGGEYGPPDRFVYEEGLDDRAAVIDDMGVDVLAVQEIGDPAALDDLLDRLEGEWTVALSTLPDARGIRVGVASRLPLADPQERVSLPAPLAPLPADDPDEALRMRRGALAVEVATDAGPVRLVTCHLKSKLVTYRDGSRTPRSEAERAVYAAWSLQRRAAEAAAVRAFCDDLLDGRGQERPLVLLGDVNDVEAAATTLILRGPSGPELDPVVPPPLDDGDGYRLWNLAPLLTDDERVSRVHRGRRELVDAVFVSRALLPRVHELRVPFVEDLPSVGDDPTVRRASPGSDHAPVVLWIDE